MSGHWRLETVKNNGAACPQVGCQQEAAKHTEGVKEDGLALQGCNSLQSKNRKQLLAKKNPPVRSALQNLLRFPKGYSLKGWSV